MIERKIIMARYKYHVAGNKVICSSTYAKKRVRGIAKCAPEDKFDIEKGRELARLRCDLKVAKKRRQRAEMETKAAWETLLKTFMRHEKMISYLHDSMKLEDQAKRALDEYRKNL